MYEEFPFPPLSLQDTTLISSKPIARHPRTFIGPSQWPDIVHHIFHGRAPTFTQDRPFRILFAGAGTGSSTILLSNQLRSLGVPFEAVHFDLSLTSVKIARARAKIKKHKNIRFVQGSLLSDVDMKNQLGDIRFDYIDCVGVLMATLSPIKVLINLRSFLHDDGGMGIMVYGKYGRAPIYQVRRTMELLSKGKRDLDIPREEGGRRNPQAARIQMLRKILKDNGNYWARSAKLESHGDEYDDVSLVDTYLHPIDNSYTVPEIFQMAHEARLHLTSFTVPLLYDATTIPNYHDTSLSSENIREWTQNLNRVELAELAETMDGTLERHEFYLTKPPLLQQPQQQQQQIDGLGSNLNQSRMKLLLSNSRLVLRIPLLFWSRTILPMLRDQSRLVVRSTDAGHRERSMEVPKELSHRDLLKVAKKIDGTKNCGEILNSLRRLTAQETARGLCKEIESQKKVLQWLGFMMTHSGYGVIHLDDAKYTWDDLFPDCVPSIHPFGRSVEEM